MLHCDCPLINQIALVSNQKLLDSSTSEGINLLQPLGDVVEGLLVCDIIHDNDTVGATVVGGCDSTETLLSSGIPLLREREGGKKGKEGG